MIRSENTLTREFLSHFQNESYIYQSIKLVNRIAPAGAISRFCHTYVQLYFIIPVNTHFRGW